MINNEIKQLVRDMKIETVTDTGTFQELESIAAELLNSNDTGNKLLAMRIQARLNENPNYLDFVKRVEIEQEVKEIENDQKIAKQQEIRQMNATANVEHRRREESKAKYEEDKKVTETFNKLTFEQQKMIIELEKNFKPEVQQELRAFLLDKEKSTPQNLVNILNKDAEGQYFKVKDDEYITTNESMPTELAKEQSVKAEKIGDIAIQTSNTDAAVNSYKAMDAANVRVATNESKEVFDDTVKNGATWTSKAKFEQKTESEKEEIAKNQSIQVLFNNKLVDEILPKHQAKIDKLAESNLDEQTKANRIASYNENLMMNIKEAIQELKVDLNNENDRQMVASLLLNVVAENKLDAKTAEKLAESLNIKDKYLEAKENFEAANSVDYDVDEPAPEAKKAEEKEVKVYDPTVDGQKQRDGIQYEANKRMRAEYNPAALRKNEEIYVAINSETNQNNANASSN